MSGLWRADREEVEVEVVSEAGSTDSSMPDLVAPSESGSSDASSLAAEQDLNDTEASEGEEPPHAGGGERRLRRVCRRAAHEEGLHPHDEAEDGQDGAPDEEELPAHGRGR